jgi:hypothetical protein
MQPTAIPPRSRPPLDPLRFYRNPQEVQRYWTEAQLVLIGILQGVALGVLADVSLREILANDPHVLKLTANERALGAAYIFVTFAVITLITYLYLVQMILYRWPLPPIHFLLWSALAACEFVMVLSANRPGSWFPATGAAGIMGVAVHLFNRHHFVRSLPRIENNSTLRQEHKQRRAWLGLQGQFAAVYGSMALLAFALTVLLATVADDYHGHIRWGGFAAANVGIVWLLFLAWCYYNDLFGALMGGEPRRLERYLITRVIVRIAKPVAWLWRYILWPWRWIPWLRQWIPCLWRRIWPPEA